MARIGKSIWIAVLFTISMAFLPLSAHAAEPVPIGTWKTAQTIQPFFYDQFLPDSMKTRVFPFTNPADQKTALLAGSLEMCGTTLAHAIYSASAGQPVVVVAALCNKCSALVVKKDGPIQTEADLKGKTIGYVPGTMHEILLRETLTRNGISPQTDVTLVRVDFFDMGTALAGGSIDAFLSGEPFPTLAVKQGYGRILAYPYYDDSVGTINAGMLVTRAAVEERPDQVAALVLAHARAARFLVDHPGQWLKRASDFGTPLDMLEAAAPNMELAWDMDETFVRQAKALGSRMQALGIIERQPDYDRLFDLSFVNQARAELK
jgi:NitT/TauT family transport system substrate-binding protein